MSRVRRSEPCDFCDGTLRPRRVTQYEERNGSGVLLQNVPVLACRGCGERYYDAAVVRWMETAFRNRIRARRRVTVPVLRYSG